VGGVDQPAQARRPAVAVLHGRGQDAVVAPVALTGELPHGQQLQRRHPELDQRREQLDEPVEGPGGCAGADVQLVEDLLVQRLGGEAGVGPVEARVVDRRGALRTLGLPPRRRVGPIDGLGVRTVQAVAVPGAGTDVGRVARWWPRASGVSGTTRSPSARTTSTRSAAGAQTWKVVPSSGRQVAPNGVVVMGTSGTGGHGRKREGPGRSRLPAGRPGGSRRPRRVPAASGSPCAHARSRAASGPRRAAGRSATADPGRPTGPRRTAPTTRP
jgi:hypothetical protein